MSKVRLDVCGDVTDKCLEEIGIDASQLPPRANLLLLIEDVARENGVNLKPAEIEYIADVNLAWVFKGLDPQKVATGVKSKDRFLVRKSEKVWS